jgi:hypothetical protein
MARKKLSDQLDKADELDGSGVGPETIEGQESLATIVEGPDGQILYVVGEWNGIPHYRCELCPFDTLTGEQAMIEHQLAAHAPTAQSSIIQIYDRRGKLVEGV